MKRILIIGGSMFVGRVFSILASQSGEFEIHVVNRGRFPLGELPNVTEYKCDRHSVPVLQRVIPNLPFDAVIDFCAEKRNDIAPVLAALASRVRQYIFISDAAAYDGSARKILFEGDVLTPDNTKTTLEAELIKAAQRSDVRYTILRPAMIYGPLNYMPREPWFIEMIARRHTVPIPIDATASFNFVYVRDVARALMTIIGDERAYDAVYNLAGAESVTYTRLISDFERYNGGSFDTRELTVREAEEEEIAFPFPLRDDRLISGAKFADTFDFRYTPFVEGMEDTFRIFYEMYVS
ncbi:MAG: NAD-dependent epimerase/dehydratase family protein [Oscillospiraceae bacterium]|jgi:nucleoside-diphosphate-sugar epimerase|nr:NAD-dependent epimerase/dehydratase family protein [Oscillospiraceae bacterium]